jgi:hypothetical protein
MLRRTIKPYQTTTLSPCHLVISHLRTAAYGFPAAIAISNVWATGRSLRGVVLSALRRTWFFNVNLFLIVQQRLKSSEQILFT